ncbi:MAG: hypothetical protein LC772_07150, partial [Chloroflexi bacterium]|nr:hypothetical protein [Chloroflexota bacterium]
LTRRKIVDRNQAIPRRLLALAEAASALKRADALPLFRQAADAAKGADEPLVAEIEVAWAAADPPHAAEVLARIPADERLWATGSAISEIARRDPAAASRLLAKAEASTSNTNSFTLNQPAIDVVQALGKTDAAAALAVAKSIKPDFLSASVMLAAADCQPREVALPLLRSLADATAESYGPTDLRSAVAAEMYRLDPPAGLALFKTIRGELFESSVGHAGATIPGFVSRYRIVDPADCYLMLERDFAILLQQGESDPARDGGLIEDCVVMAGLDLDRALQMARSLPETEQRHASSNAQLRIAQDLLSPLSPQLKRGWTVGDAGP